LIKPELTEVALVGVQPGGEAADVPDAVGTSPGAGNSGEADKDLSLLSGGAQERGCRDIAVVAIASEGAVRASTTGVDRSLRYLDSSKRVSDLYAIVKQESIFLVW
jgi:hypothetical protein